MKNENLLMFADRWGQHRYFNCFVNIWEADGEEEFGELAN
jgi:hypothetical protein